MLPPPKKKMMPNWAQCECGGGGGGGEESLGASVKIFPRTLT